MLAAASSGGKVGVRLGKQIEQEVVRLVADRVNDRLQPGGAARGDVAGEPTVLEALAKETPARRPDGYRRGRGGKIGSVHVRGP